MKTYNKIGSLTTLKSHLEENNIHDFKSLNEVINFQKSYSILRQQLISDHENLIEQEKMILNIDLPNLDEIIEKHRQNSELKLKNEIDEIKQLLNVLKNNVSKNFFHKLICSLKNLKYKREINQKENNFDNEVKKSIKKLIDDYQIKSNQIAINL